MCGRNLTFYVKTYLMGSFPADGDVDLSNDTYAELVAMTTVGDVDIDYICEYGINVFHFHVIF